MRFGCAKHTNHVRAWFRRPTARERRQDATIAIHGRTRSLRAETQQVREDDYSGPHERRSQGRTMRGKTTSDPTTTVETLTRAKSRPCSIVHSPKPKSLASRLSPVNQVNPVVPELERTVFPRTLRCPYPPKQFARGENLLLYDHCSAPFSRACWLVQHLQLYSGLGADIVGINYARKPLNDEMACYQKLPRNPP